MLSPQSRMYAKIECIWTRFLDTPLSRTRQAHVVLPPSRLDGASRTLAVGRRDTWPPLHSFTSSSPPDFFPSLSRLFVL